MNEDWKNADSEEADWDEAFADLLLGSYVLIGLTYRDPAKEILETRQLHGHVHQVDRIAGIIVRLEGKSAEEVDFCLPPDLSVFEKAEEGIYESKEGDVIRDPDYVAYWTITKPTS